MFNNYITVCPERMKNKKHHIWPIFTCVNRTFDTGHPIHVKLTSVACCAPAQTCLFRCKFPLSDERSWVSWQESSKGVDSESLLTAQPSHGWMYDNITLHSLCYLARVMPVTQPMEVNYDFSLKDSIQKYSCVQSYVQTETNRRRKCQTGLI